MAFILLVDDEPLLRRTMRLPLERAGHRVHEAEDGDACLRSFRQSRPDLVLLDIVMPNREGLETIVALRGLDVRVPIIAISGAGSDGAGLFLDLAGQLGATRRLAKPFGAAELMAVVEECLSLADVQAS